MEGNAARGEWARVSEGGSGGARWTVLRPARLEEGEYMRRLREAAGEAAQRARMAQPEAEGAGERGS